MFEDKIISINPVHFFALSCDCHYLANTNLLSSQAKYKIPSTTHLTNETAFADIAIGWHEDGIAIYVEVKQAAVQSFYPKIELGDSVELFFDTRDLKSAGFNTRFCHHFYFLPIPVEEVSKGEKTHFRTEDCHVLCNDQSLSCETQLKKNLYQMKIFIPTECLYGYDSKQFNRMGFTYRINRYKGLAQHFSVVSKNYQIDQQPSLWGSMQLVK